MKSSVRHSKTTKVPLRSGSSRVLRATKRLGKQTLRDLLLSKTFYKGFRAVVGLMIVSSALYGSYAFIGTKIGNDIIVSQSEIVARVGKHIELPQGEPDAVVRVQDPETLQKQALLYENVKEGDYIVIYPTVAVVYDLRNDHIVAMKRTSR